MDLSTLLPKNDAVIQLKHPVTGEFLPDIEVQIVGHDSSVFKNAIKARAKAQIARKSKELDLNANERDTIELLAQCTLGWKGISEGSKVIEFSFDNAVSLYTRYNWIKEQIDNAISDRANFFINA